MSPAPAHAVVLAGGRGTRFWPLSRAARPKQLLDMTGEGSLLALTLERLEPLVPPQRQWIITSKDLTEAVAEAAPRVPRAQILAEPSGRNTAPAVGLAAAVLQERHGDVPFAVLPSDHIITPAEDFRGVLARAFEIAAGQDLLLTFGVEPTRPETGYGYIEEAGSLEAAPPARRVARFTEKPDRATAEGYLRGGRHLWNSGIFAWRSSVVLAGLDTHMPAGAAALRRCAATAAPGTAGFERALEEAYGRVESISIDYALLEKAENVAVLPADFGWNDVGHWLAMRDLWPRDEAGNAARGEVLALDSSDCIVHGPDRLTALLGVKGLIVVQTPDATLICDAARAQDVKRVLEALEEQGRDELL